MLFQRCIILYPHNFYSIVYAKWNCLLERHLVPLFLIKPSEQYSCMRSVSTDYLFQMKHLIWESFFYDNDNARFV